MKKKQIFMTESKPIAEHPAASMWSRLGNKEDSIRSIEVLRGLDWDKSNIYRLIGAGRHGESIIAKLARKESLLVEREVYEYIMCHVAVESPGYYGFIEQDSQFAWLFLEEVTGHAYDENKPHHRELASKWLAMFHSATGRMSLNGTIPRLDLVRYREYVELALRKLHRCDENEALSSRQRTLIHGILRNCEVVQQHWGVIKEIYEMAPTCLVHGDFIKKNVRVSGNREAPKLYVLDWESAGWGCPAEDLAGLDLTVYHDIIRGTSFSMDLALLEKLAGIGMIFRYIAWIQATAVGLKYDYIDSTLAALDAYGEELALACRAMKWSS